MPDTTPDPMPDPMDDAYAQAEAMLSDDDARAARRARVLAAVAQAAPEPAAAPTSRGWGRSGWLVAASLVGGVSVVLATQVRPPPAEAPEPRPPLAAPVEPAAKATTPQPMTPPAAAPSASATRVARAAPAAPPRAVTAATPRLEPVSPPVEIAPPPPPVTAPPPPPPPPPPPAAAAPAQSPPQAGYARRIGPAPAPAPPAAQPAGRGVEEVVVTASKREATVEDAPSRATIVRPLDAPARLRDAAARGRTSEVARLLARGALVDEADDDGETALMKAIRNRRASTAALLRRHGADLERKNREGVSARDMAKALGDAKLDRALGLDD